VCGKLKSKNSRRVCESPTEYFDSRCSLLESQRLDRIQPRCLLRRVIAGN
jgi:hypothetical protein